MLKIFKIILPIIILAIFITLMNSGGFIKKPINKEDDVFFYLEAIESNAITEKWEAANNYMHSLEKAWKKVMFRLQFIVEGNRIDNFSSELPHLRGAIRVKSKKDVIVEIEALKDIWNRIED